MVNINIEVPDEIHKKAKINAVVLDIDLKDYIIKAIEKENKKGEK